MYVILCFITLLSTGGTQEIILCPLSVFAIGVSYFVYGEMIDVYSGDPKLQEFMDIGLKFTQSIASIPMALPLYKLHIYTKPYRDYVDTLNKLQDRGMQH